MKNSKNKKRLSYTIVAFLFTFLVGAAFAFADGVLDIHGTLRLTAPTDYVFWYAVNYGEDFLAPLGFSFSATQSASIVDRPGPGTLDRTNQRISWNMDFRFTPGMGDEFVAQITATARNASMHPAFIDGFTYEWDYIWDYDTHGFTFADFGFEVFINPLLDNLSNQVLQPFTNNTVVVEVQWDGTIPVGFETDLNIYELVANLTVEFDYTVAP